MQKEASVLGVIQPNSAPLFGSDAPSIDAMGVAKNWDRSFNRKKQATKHE